jgi:hypothetical protein
LQLCSERQWKLDWRKVRAYLQAAPSVLLLLGLVRTTVD